MKNTLKKGKFRILIYKEKGTNLYYATVLEFNLTLTSDNPDELRIEILQAAKDYIQSARELKAPEVLNQTPDPELERIWNHLLQTSDNKSKQKTYSSSYIPVSAQLETV